MQPFHNPRFYDGAKLRYITHLCYRWSDWVTVYRSVKQFVYRVIRICTQNVQSFTSTLLRGSRLLLPRCQLQRAGARICSFNKLSTTCACLRHYNVQYIEHALRTFVLWRFVHTALQLSIKEGPLRFAGVNHTFAPTCFVNRRRNTTQASAKWRHMLISKAPFQKGTKACEWKEPISGSLFSSAKAVKYSQNNTLNCLFSTPSFC